MAAFKTSVYNHRPKIFWSRPSTSLVVGMAVFAACMFGILTRPAGLLAMIWPANAVMLGLLVRLPDTRRASVWLSAAAAYMAADLAAGTDLAKTLLLNAGNLCGVGAGYLLSRRLPDHALRMREPAFALYIIPVSAVAAAAAGLAGAITDPYVLKLGAVDGGVLWFSTELVNYIALLPVILSAPSPRDLISDLKSSSPAACLRCAAPALALVTSCALSMAIGGPGAIAFAVPALLWCGLVYPVFVVSILTFMFSCWALIVMTAAYLPGAAGIYDPNPMVSMRLAAFMIALTPVTLSIVVRNRDELIGKLSLARQRIDMAMDAGGIVATWNLSIAENGLTIEGDLPGLLEVDDKSRSGLFQDNLADIIHPDDREKVYAALRAAMATGTDYRCRHRIVTRDGEIRWLAAFGKLVRDGQDAPSRLIGILIDVTEKTEAAEALEQSNRRFNIVSEFIPQIVWSADASGRHDYFNRRWTEFTGIAPRDIGPETWKELVHPQDKPRVDRAWEACLATGETYSIDYRYRYRDGSYRWLKVLAKPLRDADGALTRWYGTSTDIDDVKQLEAEREIVARELDHRIGNLFALVTALVNLTAREAPDVQAMTDALRGRLTTLHDAHGLIRHHQDIAPTTVVELLRRILAPYENGTERVVIAGDDLPVASTAITSIALIFHELATNAVKHGALKDSEGLLRIDLRRNGDRFMIDWQEVSHSRTAACPGTGFGSRLLESIVGGQLRGKATRSASAHGLTIGIDLPVSSLAGGGMRH